MAKNSFRLKNQLKSSVKSSECRALGPRFKLFDPLLDFKSNFLFCFDIVCVSIVLHMSIISLKSQTFFQLFIFFVFQNYISSMVSFDLLHLLRPHLRVIWLIMHVYTFRLHKYLTSCIAFLKALLYWKYLCTLVLKIQYKVENILFI